MKTSGSRAAVDYYAVLGVLRDALDDEIKAAYRRLAREWHPDASDDPKAAERFQEINEAKDVLLDPEQRAEHDRRLDGGVSADDEWAPTIVTVEPESIDFGVLKVGGAAVESEIVLSWEGTAPGMVRPGTRGGNWWELFHVEVRGANAIAFSLRAQAYDGLPGGRHAVQFDLMADADLYSVELVMTVAGAKMSAAAASGGGSASVGDRDDADDWSRPTAAFGGLATTPSIVSDVLTVASRLRYVLPNGWLLAVAAFVLIFGVLHVGWPFGHAAPRTFPQYAVQPATSAVVSAKPEAPHEPLPERASAIFGLTPAASFHGVSGPSSIGPNGGYSVSVVPTYHDFVLTLRLRVTYTLPPLLTGLADGIAGSTMDVKAGPGDGYDYSPANGVYDEESLSASLQDNGRGVVTGSLSFAAVLPGQYSFDFFGQGDGEPTALFEVGNVETPHIGVATGDYPDAEGYADYSAMAVFSVRQARHDTVLVFGQVGPTGSAKPPSAACVELLNGRKLYPVATSVAIHGVDDGQAYALGTLQFDMSGSEVVGANIFYNCAAGTSQDYVRID
jgi:hypothetical protein